jgi:uncharacterized protein DUF1566
MTDLLLVTRLLRSARTLLFSICVVLMQAWSAQAADLVIHADAECRLLVDGKAQGTIASGQKLELQLLAGKHELKAIASADGSKWEKTITISDSDTREELTIHFESSHDYWIDPATRLMWTVADNGSGLSWNQALRYCSELRAAGFRDWVLPAIDDLQRVFEPALNQGGFHVKGPFKLTGWQWSSTPGSQRGEGWAFDFGDGGRASVAAGDSGLNRALCVRHAAE